MARQLHLIRAIVTPRRPVPGLGLLGPSVTRMRVGPGDLDLYMERPSGDRVPAPEVVELLGGGVESPPLPDDVAGWARAAGVAHRG